MTLYATISGETFSFSVASSNKAKDDVRFKFNPSGLREVNEIKALGVLWLSKLEEIAATHPHAARELAVARTEFQKASMFAVLGITKEV